MSQSVYFVTTKSDQEKSYLIKVLILLLQLPRTSLQRTEARNCLHFCLTTKICVSICCNAWSNLMQELPFLAFMGGSNLNAHSNYLICIHFKYCAITWTTKTSLLFQPQWLPWLQRNWRNSGYESFTLVLKSNCIRQQDSNSHVSKLISKKKQAVNSYFTLECTTYAE